MALTMEQFEQMVEVRKNEWLDDVRAEVEKYDAREREKSDYLSRYVDFIDKNRTVREVNRAVYQRALDNGFVPYEYVASGLVKSRKIAYHSVDWKNTAFAVIGEEDLTESGITMSVAHTDAPRFDLKPNPIIVTKDEKGNGEKGLVKLDTHYYGGFIKGEAFGSYELRGEVVDEGKVKKLNNIKLVLPPLLPHLNHDAGEMPVSKAYPADKMDMITGMTTEKEFLSAVGLKSSEDFSVADIEIVPDEPVRRVGELIVGYGQDDRSCVFAQTEALIAAADKTKKTCIVINTDREEIGSDGTSGIQSNFKDVVIARTVRLQRRGDYKGLEESAFITEDVFPKSLCISSDVSATLDPTYPEKFDPANAPHMGLGVVIERYTGSGGKFEASEASPETMYRLVTALKKRDVKFQDRMLSGRLDVGGGGTVARYIAKLMPVVDMGPGLLGMHSRVETLHEDDAFGTYEAVVAVFI